MVEKAIPDSGKDASRLKGLPPMREGLKKSAIEKMDSPLTLDPSPRQDKGKVNLRCDTLALFVGRGCPKGG